MILTAVLLVYSCNAPTKAANDQNITIQKQEFTIISATRSRWFGGREGVKGWNYTVRLKNNQKNSFLFKNLVVNHVKSPVTTKMEGKFIVLTTSISDQRDEPLTDAASGQEIPSKTSSVNASQYYLEYTTGTAKTVKKLVIPNFTVTESKEFYP